MDNILHFDNVSDIAHCKALIKTEKSRGARPVREIFWSSETNTAIEQWIDCRKSYAKDDVQQLFVCLGKGKKGQGISPKAAGEALRKYCEELNIPRINPHSFRHSLAREIIKKGGSAVDVMNILGHATLASSTIYTQMYGAELEERYRKVLEK